MRKKQWLLGQEERKAPPRDAAEPFFTWEEDAFCP